MQQGTYRRRHRSVAVAIGFSLWVTRPALAGMPSFTLTDIAAARLQTISFFILVLLLGAGAIQLIWNRLRNDFQRLPRLTYPRALGIVCLWGFVFALVLTMISGARELLTPGAWERDGAIYRLSKSPGTTSDDREVVQRAESDRQGRLMALKVLLWAYAAAHAGELPPDDRAPEMPAMAWETPDPSRIRYHYIPGRKVGERADPVAYEPAAAFASPRWVLTSDGRITQMSDSDLAAAMRKGGAP
jgi:hypothetical protein